MLGVGKVGGGGDSYYLEAVASGADEYYRGIGEAPGRWVGESAVELGLSGEVEPDDLKAIWNGLDPATGEKLGCFPNRTVDMFDLCFKAPKSVSLLFGLGGQEIADHVRDGHEAAVTAALDYLERTAVRSRAGKGGARSVEVSGLVAAAFRHRTSRSGDPHLHTHVLAANMAHGVDGKWRTLDGRVLYHHSKTAGYLYQAQLRKELTARLGVDWHQPENGLADIVGIDREVIDAFSDRSKQIQEHLDKVGFRSARAAQIATLDTRDDKDPTVDPASMRDVWLAKAAEIGFDPATLDTVLDRAEPRILDLDGAELLDFLRGPRGLTDKASTFDRRDVLRGIAGHLRLGATVAEVEQWVGELVASPDVVRLHDRDGLDATTTIRRRDGRIVAAPVVNERWSTVELLTLEAGLIDASVAAEDGEYGLVPEKTVEAALAKRPSLRPEQVAMVARLTTSGAGVDVVAAAAGTGKTFAMDAARDAWQSGGYRLLGASLAAEAAHELESAAGIPSTTLAMLDIQLTQGRQYFDARTVLVIDEASMAGTRSLARVMRTALACHTKVVLVGDPKQLPEIDAGGVLNGLCRRLDPIELTDNRRQDAEWERAAVKQLRDGDLDIALDAYRRHDRVVTAETAPDVRATMVADWWAWRTSGAAVRMMAIRHVDVDDLNGRARAYLARAGQLNGPELELNGDTFQAGDDVMCRRNNYRIGVRNGMAATVEAVDVDARTMTIRNCEDEVITLPSKYLEKGWVGHGYAATIHKSEGKTVDHALLLGSDELYRSRGYVGMSRGRQTNHLYIVDTPHPERIAEHHPEPEPQDPWDLLCEALRKEDAKQLAIDSGDAVEMWSLDRLVVERDRLQTIFDNCPEDRTVDHKSLGARCRQLETELQPIIERYNELADRRVRLPKHRAEIVTLHADITNRRQGLADVQRELHEVGQHTRKRARYIESHQIDADRWNVVDQCIDARLLERVDQYLYRTPHQYLSNAIGSPPVLNRTELDRWRMDAVKIERYRLDHNITGPATFGLDRFGNPARPPFELHHEVRREPPSTPTIETPSRPTIEPPDLGLGL